MKHKILIIEDNRDVRENLAEILTLSGYECKVAANGKEGVQAVFEDKPDLIVCDIMMPELDGFGVLRIISKNDVTADIPFIFLTAKTELTDIRRGMMLGADDYITKPFDDVELLDTIEMRLKKRKPSTTSGSPLAFIQTLTTEQLWHFIPDNLKNGEPRMIRRKDLLYAEGQTCRSVFILYAGRAVATKVDDYSKEVVTRFYHGPAMIGVSSALTGSRYKNTVRALEDIEVVPIGKDDFLQFLVTTPDATWYFLRQMARDSQKADEKLLLQAFGTVRMKLAATLIDLYYIYSGNGTAVIPVSREELASMAGTAKETIIRCLSEFRDEGLVTVRGAEIVISDIDKLTRIRF